MNKFLNNIKLNIVSLAIPAAVCVIICTFILTGITFSWFSSTVHATSSVIKSGEFEVEVTVTPDNTAESNTVAVSELEATTFANITKNSDDSYTLGAGTYNVTLKFAGNVDGWVKIGVEADDKITPVWNSIQLGPQPIYNIAHSFKLTVDNELKEATIKFEPTWTEPVGLSTLGNILNITPNTANSVATFAVLSEYNAMAIEGNPVWSVDAISGFLFELTSGEYYNGSGERVEPTTGFVYNEAGLLVHPVSGKTGSLNELGQLIDSESGMVIAIESGNLIDTDTGLEINPEGYLIDTATGNLIDPETFYYVIADSEYQIVPATGYLFNKANGTYHDPITYEEVIADVALGIVPPIEEVTTTEDLEYYDDSEAVTEVSDPVTDVSEVTSEVTTVIYNYIESFAYIPDTVEYQLNPISIVDPITGLVTWQLYNTVDMTIVELNIFAADYIDPTTGYYIIPGSVYQVIPATGYLYCSTSIDPAYMYINPLNGTFAGYNEAHGIVEEVTEAVTEATDVTTTEEAETSEATTEAVTEATEETTTEVTTTTEEVTTPEVTTTSETTTEVTTTVTEATTEPAVTSVPETDPSI